MKTPLTFCILLYLCPLPTRAQTGSPFRNGFARITQDNRTFFIDTTGAIAFDSLSGTFQLMDDTSGGLLPGSAPLVFKGGKMGVLDLDGSWLLAPVYDSIDRRWPVAWKASRDGKTSFFRRSGFVLPFTFEDVLWLDSNYFAVRKQEKWGVYSRREDKVLLPFEYDDVDYCSGCGAEGNYVFASRGGKWGVVGFSGKVLVPFIYDHEHMNMRSDEWVECLSLNGNNVLINLNTGKVDTCPCKAEDDDEDQEQGLPSPLVAMNKGNKFGVTDTNGRIIVPCVYDQWFTTTKDSTLLMSKRGKRDILLDLRGKPVLPPGYDTLEEITIGTSTNLIKITKRGLLGLYNPRTGKIVPPRYTNLQEGYYHLDQPVLEASIGQRLGLIDTGGNILIPPVYTYIDNTSRPGMVWVKNTVYRNHEKTIKSGLFSILAGRVLIPALYDDIGYCDSNSHLVIVQKGDRYGILTTGGDTLCVPVYDDITEIDSLSFLLKRHNRYHVLHADTRALDTLSFDNALIAGYKALLIVTTKDGKRLYDAATRTLIPGNYTDIGTYGAGLFMVTQGTLFGFIDPDGKAIVPVTYDNASTFENGVAMIFRKRPEIDLYRYGFIDSTGKVLVPVQYDFAQDAADYFQDGFLMLRKGDMDAKWGLTHHDGSVLIPPVYDQIDVLHPGNWFLVKAGEMSGLLDSAGHAFIPDSCTDMGADRQTPLYFPLLYKTGDEWRYMGKDGKALPYVLKEVGTFDGEGY